MKAWLLVAAVVGLASEASAQGFGGGGGCPEGPCRPPSDYNGSPYPTAPTIPLGTTGIPLCSYVCNDSGNYDVVFPAGYSECDSSAWGTLPLPCRRPIVWAQPTSPSNEQLVEIMLTPILEGLKARYGIK